MDLFRVLQNVTKEISKNEIGRLLQGLPYHSDKKINIPPYTNVMGFRSNFLRDALESMEVSALERKQSSISSTFNIQIFHTNVVTAAFSMYM